MASSKVISSYQPENGLGVISLSVQTYATQSSVPLSDLLSGGYSFFCAGSAAGEACETGTEAGGSKGAGAVWAGTTVSVEVIVGLGPADGTGSVETKIGDAALSAAFA